jgi:predicted unusual protein kinase regulating ubiquinone biosynthesis (AarF/ABC1/UbiB family)
VKIGQVFSSFGDAGVPRQFADSLAVLQHDSPARRPASYVRGVIERELGASVETLFSSFEDEPLGAASIGQVHSPSHFNSRVRTPTEREARGWGRGGTDAQGPRRLS